MVGWRLDLEKIIGKGLVKNKRGELSNQHPQSDPNLGSSKSRDSNQAHLGSLDLRGLL